MNIFNAGFFGLIVIAFSMAVRFFYLSPFYDTQAASEYMLQTSISELENKLITAIEDKKSFTGEFVILTANVDAPTVIARKCEALQSSKVDDCKYNLGHIFDILTIEDDQPGWREVCEKFHVNSLQIYECIRNFKINNAWTDSKLISPKENARIKECFRNIPKSKYTQCIN